MITLPAYTHFFSYETKVSLELPSGWTLESESEKTAVYTVDVGESPPPKFLVKTIGLPQSQSGSYQELAQALLSIPRIDFVLRAQNLSEVDNQHASIHIFSYFEPEIGQRLLQYQVIVHAERVIFSLTGVGREAQAENLLPIFETAIQSVRFVPA